ncbi:MAG TPA: hypothetical protein VFP15_03400, partial [Gemmatimonadaceae bacterium]|nr:hypothetical protein [Gemmatimonadaceae bacterium]
MSLRGVAPRKLKMLSVTLVITRWGIESRVVRGVVLRTDSAPADADAAVDAGVASRGGVRRSGLAARRESIHAAAAAICAESAGGLAWVESVGGATTTGAVTMGFGAGARAVVVAMVPALVVLTRVEWREINAAEPLTTSRMARMATEAMAQRCLVVGPAGREYSLT